MDIEFVGHDVEVSENLKVPDLYFPCQHSKFQVPGPDPDFKIQISKLKHHSSPVTCVGLGGKGEAQLASNQ